MHRCRIGVAALAVAVALVSGCSTTAWNEMRANPREYFNLNAPTLQTDARVAGSEVVLKRGQALVVRLDEDPASGERWEIRALGSGSVIAPVQRDAVAGERGSAGDAVFRLRGVVTGRETIVLESRRPFDTAAIRTVRFDIVVR